MSGLSRLRIEPGDASEFWKRWEERTVAEKFPLRSYLAGCDGSSVFLTAMGAGGDLENAAIKLIYASAPDAEKRLHLWRSARELSHPNLIQVFEAGRCEIDGIQLLYVVEEYAEENLSQIVPERALTPEETREMLPPILRALQYLHEKGFGHGRIQPSNILAVGDKVKLSSDALVALGEKNRRATVADAYEPPEADSDTVSSAADIWRLGITLIEVLTQQLPVWDRGRSNSPEIPPSVTEPFRDIAKHCLQVEPGQRWTIAQILHRLEPEQSGAKQVELPQGGPLLLESEASRREASRGERATVVSSAPEPQKASAKWPYLLGLAAVVAVALVLIFRAKAPGPALDTQSATVQSGQSQSAEPVQSAQSPAKANAGAGNSSASRSDGANSASQDGIVHRVVPEISPSARRTIQGRILIRVRVKVNAAGDVTQATRLTANASKYFSRMAVEAAREWKFSPEQTAGQSGDRGWNLQFAFSRAKTEVSAAAIGR